MNNNTKAKYKSLSKKERRASAALGIERKSKFAKVARGTKRA